MYIVFDETNHSFMSLSFDEDRVNDPQSKARIDITPNPSTFESTTIHPESDSIDETDKINVPREWRNNDSFPNDFIIGNLNDKVETRASLRK